MAFKRHSNTVASASFGPDGRHVITGSWDRTAIVWDVGSAEPVRVIGQFGASVGCVAYSPDGSTAAVCSSDGTARIVNIRAEGKDILIAPGALHAAFTPDGRRLLVCSLRWGQPMLCDAVTGKAVCTLGARSGRATATAVSRDGRQIAVGFENGAAVVHDLRASHSRESAQWSSPADSCFGI